MPDTTSRTPASLSTTRPLRAALADRAFLKAVLIATAVAGTLDIIAAHLHFWAATGNFPANLLKGIAGGALGRPRAMQGGAEMLALGLFFHFLISAAFALLYFVLYPRLALLRKSPWTGGTLYALFVWTVMNYVVVPSSALQAGFPNFASKHTYLGLLVLITIFGLPIAFIAARYYRRSA